VSISDFDRDRTIRELRDRYAREALTEEEFDQSVTAALHAQTRAELAQLVQRETPHPRQVAVNSHADTAERQRVERHLAAGEWIEWIGRPDPSKHFNRGDVFLVPFSLLWGGFAIFWEAAAIKSGGPFFIVWGFAFVLVGLYMIGGRFIYKQRRRRRTTYAVTNRRTLRIVERARGETVDARYLRSLSSVSTHVGSDGHGTIELDGSGPFPPWRADSGMELFGWGRYGPLGLSFSDIEDARGVADLIESLRDQQA
jgi:uncharacterized membrane protein